MKGSRSLMIVLVTLFTVCMALSPGVRRSAEKEILDSCKNAVDALDDDVNQILNRKIPTNHNGKCLLKCAYEKIGIIVNGRLSFGHMRQLGAKELEGDSKALNILNGMIDECERKVTDPDLCEQSCKMMDCMTKTGLQRGIDPKKGIRESLGSI